MKIQYLGPTVITDNDILLINTITTILEYSDPSAEIFVAKETDKLVGHITVSNMEFRDRIISNLLWINRVLKIKIKYSSSLAISSKVSFIIES